MAPSKVKAFKVPTKPAEAGDLLYQLREQRYAMQKQVDEIAKQETELRNFLINTLPKGSASGISGSIARVEIQVSSEPVVTDWTEFQKYVKRTGRFDILQRRINPAAIKEMWEAKKKVPGVGTFETIKVSCTKK